jgi:hypothetical protein
MSLAAFDGGESDGSADEAGDSAGDVEIEEDAQIESPLVVEDRRPPNLECSARRRAS